MGGRKNGGAESQRRGRAGVILRKGGAAFAGKEQPGGAGTDLDTSGLFGAQPIAAENRGADGCMGSANMRALGINNGSERRRRSGPDGRDQECVRKQRCDNSTGHRLPPAFAARAPARIPLDNFRIFTRRRATPWWRSNWRSFSKLRGRMPMPRNGIPWPRRDSAARIGKLKRRKPRFVLAALRGRSRWKREPHRRRNLL